AASCGGGRKMTATGGVVLSHGVSCERMRGPSLPVCQLRGGFGRLPPSTQVIELQKLVALKLGQPASLPLGLGRSLQGCPARLPTYFTCRTRRRIFIPAPLASRGVFGRSGRCGCGDAVSPRGRGPCASAPAAAAARSPCQHGTGRYSAAAC